LKTIPNIKKEQTRKKEEKNTFGEYDDELKDLSIRYEHEPYSWVQTPKEPNSLAKEKNPTKYYVGR